MSTKAEPFSTFDNPVTREFTQARQAFTDDFLRSLGQSIELSTAADIGCGVGDFSKFMADRGLTVIGVDGREENTAEARRRYPQITFKTADAEQLHLSELGTFDFVLCFGLLYHLENPFRTIRKLCSLTRKILLVESICMPGEATTMELLDESRDENQGLNYVAFYPSEACLIKMLYRAGFPYVYAFRALPDHQLYKADLWRRRQRTVLAAARIELTASNLVTASERIQTPFGEINPWTTRLARTRQSIKSKVFSIRFLAKRLLKQGRTS
jgi:trans-aconitate methyltransferase